MREDAGNDGALSEGPLCASLELSWTVLSSEGAVEEDEAVCLPVDGGAESKS